MDSELDFTDEDLREALKEIGAYVYISEENPKKICAFAV